nr:ribonuclease H-like domain-containing protein [Tanacetum cinerariifolium]
MDHKVKTIRSGNGTEFKNRIMNEFCEMKVLGENLVLLGYNPKYLRSPSFVGNQTNGNAGTKANINARQAGKKTVSGPQYVLLPLLTFDSQGPKSSEDEVVDDAGKKRREKTQRNEFEIMFGQDKDANGNRMFTPVSTTRSTYVYLGGSIPINVATLPNDDLPTDPLMLNLEDTVDTGILSGAYDDEVKGVEADFNSLELTIVFRTSPSSQIIKKLMVDLLHLEEILKEVKFLEKKNSVLFIDTKCVVLSPDFKLLDESQVLLKVPRNNNMYSFDLKNDVPVGGLTCLFAKATLDESNLWHRRLGHINFKTMNKLVRGNLVRGIENQMDQKVKTIRSGNGTEFKNRIMNEFCEMKGHPQQALKNKGIVNSGCSRYITGNKAYLADYQEINDEGIVAFGSSRGKITSKDKKNHVLFTETKCLVLSPNFKLLDESQLLLRIPRQSNMYSFDLRNVVPSGDLTCLFAKASIDESNL